MGGDRNYPGKSGIVSLVLIVFSLLFILGQSAHAQVDEGAVTGIVQDTTGAVVPNAQVTLLNIDQGISLNTKTDNAGSYTFSPVRIGRYTVSVTAQGFEKTTQSNVTVQVAQTVQVNVQLKPGASTETVYVNTAPPLMQTQEASVGQTIGSQEVNNLPLNGRNFTFLAQLGAGMQTPQADTRGNAASRTEQLPAGRHRQQLQRGRFSERNELRHSASCGRDSGVQGADRRLQRRTGACRRRSAECDHQVRHQQHSRCSLGVLPQRQAGRGRLF
jgi:hypothetical protein